MYVFHWWLPSWYLQCVLYFYMPFIKNSTSFRFYFRQPVLSKLSSVIIVSLAPLLWNAKFLISIFKTNEENQRVYFYLMIIWYWLLRLWTMRTPVKEVRFAEVLLFLSVHRYSGYEHGDVTLVASLMSAPCGCGSWRGRSKRSHIGSCHCAPADAHRLIELS